jgi:tetratricopeptide (TPR) repeat protein
MKRTIYILVVFMTACGSKSQVDKSLALALRSDTLIKEDRLDEAEIVITEAIKLDKGNHIAYNNLGILRMRQNLSSEQIIEPFIKSLSINPYYETAAYNLANYYHEIKDYPNALIFCTKYLALNRNNKEMPGTISHIYAIRSESENIGKQFHEAILDSDSALSHNTRSYWAYKERGTAYRELRQFDEAIKNYLKAIDINPDYAQAYNGLAICYDDGKKDFNSALQYYTKAIDLDSQSATYIYNRGACLFANGFKDKAISDLRKADKLGKQEAKSYLEKY